MMDVCAELVRQHDKDRFLATLFAPEDKQRPLMTLYAFKCEIERIPFLVSEPQVGEIRLRWWIDTLEQMASGETLDHPVAEELRNVVGNHRLPIQSLVQLVEAHQFDLYADHMPSRNDLEGYLGETESVLFQLGSMVVDPVAAAEIAHSSGFAGVALGMARLLNRGVGHFMPRSESAGSLSALARLRLSELRMQKLPRNLLPVFLPASLTTTYLDAGQKQVPQWKRQWKLWRAARKESL